MNSLRVSSLSQFVEQEFHRVPPREISSDWFLQSSLAGLRPNYLFVKRIIDIVIAAFGLLITSPLLLVAAIVIKATSPGPAFYSQIRVGLHNRPFRIFKLRTMRIDAEQTGAQWAKVGDPRVTRIGKILRKTRIDELPQFVNILRGDMALVGPRPERPEFTDYLAQVIPFYKERHLIKPGLTGWAQIHYPYGASEEDAERKLEYDLYSVKYGSLLLDLQITIRTIGVIMKGAR